MSFFPRFAPGDFTPLFRLLDDFASNQVTRGKPAGCSRPSFRSFQPRFDVKEVNDAYELEGELPGIDQKDIEIEFTEPQTLSIRGHSERTRETGTQPQHAAVEGEAEQAKITQDGAESPNYQQPSVEEDSDWTMAGGNPDAEPTTTEGAVTPHTVTEKQPEQSEQTEEQHKQRYWVSERSTGEFRRTFNFPVRIDQDNVTASLKNGVLSIHVPKAPAPVSRKINIE
ncbi:hypothetical protein ANO11243_026940 [Dothideomycetidae sp. 11243]|nr:hypothetical protein ANO11243_026940 [fungal sp. No.11243]